MQILFLVLGILLVLGLLGVLFSKHKGNDIPNLVPIVLMGLGSLLLVGSFFVGGTPEPATIADREQGIQEAIGNVLAKQALTDLSAGSLLVVTHPHPGWAGYGEAFARGVQAGVEGTACSAEILSLEGYSTTDKPIPDIAAIAREMAKQKIPKADAILFGFPMFGDLGGGWPRLPPMYGVYEGQATTWQNLVKLKRFHAIARGGFQTPVATDDPALNRFQKEYILVTMENLSQNEMLP